MTRVFKKIKEKNENQNGKNACKLTRLQRKRELFKVTKVFKKMERKIIQKIKMEKMLEQAYKDAKKEGTFSR